MNKPKSGVYDKAKIKNGVVEGGIAALAKIKEKPESLNAQNAVRICCFVPEEMRRTYRAILAKLGSNTQADLLHYIESVVEKNNK